jgi:excisionase family DNA binding protein
MTVVRRELVDIDEAASWLGVDVRFMRRLVAERRITYYKVGRYLRFDAVDLDDFLQAARVDKSEAA